MKNYFSTNLKYLRQQKNYTQTHLAEVLQKDYSTIGKWENEKRCPTLEDAIIVAEIFDIPIGDLLLKDLRIKNDIILENQFDSDIQKIAIDNQIEIRYHKNAKLTSDTATKAIAAIMEVLEENQKN